MALCDSHNPVGRWQDPAAASGSGLYEAETGFLEYCIRSVESDLEQIRNNLGTTYARDGGDPSPGEQQLLDTYQKEYDILRGLLANPRRKERSLEHLLGDWLRRADDRMVDLARTTLGRGGNAPAFWELQQEHDIRSTLLRNWWHWLHGNDDERTPGRS